MRLKVFIVTALLALVGCTDSATVGTLSAVRCSNGVCTVVFATKDYYGSQTFTEYRACNSDVEKLLARKVIMINKPGACMAIYDYGQ